MSTVVVVMHSCVYGNRFFSVFLAVPLVSINYKFDLLSSANPIHYITNNIHSAKQKINYTVSIIHNTGKTYEFTVVSSVLYDWFVLRLSLASGCPLYSCDINTWTVN